MSLESSSLSLPASPTINQTHDYAGRTWQWDGRRWKQVVPAWAANLADPPGLVRLAFGSINNATTADFSLVGFRDIYRGFLWHLTNWVPVTNGAVFSAHFSQDGITYDAAAGTYRYTHNSTTSAGTSTIANAASTVLSIAQGPGGVGNLINQGVAAFVELWGAKTTPRILVTSYSIDGQATPEGAAVSLGGGQRVAAAQCFGVQFGFTGGTISGDYAFYGYT
jgi:hypothetical protein